MNSYFSSEADVAPPPPPPPDAAHAADDADTRGFVGMPYLLVFFYSIDEYTALVVLFRYFVRKY